MHSDFPSLGCLPIPTYPHCVELWSGWESNPHGRFGPRDFKQDIFFSLGLSHHLAYLFRCWALNPVIKKIHFPGSLYTFPKFTLGLARPPGFPFSRIHPVCIIYFYIMGTMALFHSPSLVSTISPPDRTTIWFSSIRKLGLLKLPFV